MKLCFHHEGISKNEKNEYESCDQTRLSNSPDYIRHFARNMALGMVSVHTKNKHRDKPNRTIWLSTISETFFCRQPLLFFNNLKNAESAKRPIIPNKEPNPN